MSLSYEKNLDPDQLLQLVGDYCDGTIKSNKAEETFEFINKNSFLLTTMHAELGNVIEEKTGIPAYRSQKDGYNDESSHHIAFNAVQRVRTITMTRDFLANPESSEYKQELLGCVKDHRHLSSRLAFAEELSNAFIDEHPALENINFPHEKSLLEVEGFEKRAAQLLGLKTDEPEKNSIEEYIEGNIVVYKTYMEELGKRMVNAKALKAEWPKNQTSITDYFRESNNEDKPTFYSLSAQKAEQENDDQSNLPGIRSMQDLENIMNKIKLDEQENAEPVFKKLPFGMKPSNN